MTRTALSRAAPALWTTVLAALAGALLHLVSVRTATGQRLDERLLGGLQVGDDGVRVGAASDALLDTIGVGSLALATAALVAIALWRRLPRTAAAAAIIVAGANLTTQFLKRRLERPDLSESWWDGPGSFPSGHATVAMTLALAAVLVVPPAARLAVAVAGGGYAALVGTALVGLSWHRPGEVLGAYLVALAWFALAAAVIQVFPDRVRVARRPSARARRLAWLAAAAVLVALTVVLARLAGEIDLAAFARERTGPLLVATVCGLGATATLMAALRIAPRSGGVRRRR